MWNVFKRLFPGRQISAKSMNVALRTVEEQDRPATGPALLIRRGFGAQQLAAAQNVTNPHTWIKLVMPVPPPTSGGMVDSSGAYCWIEQLRLEDDFWEDDADGLAGFNRADTRGPVLPAYEVNDNETIKAGTVVRAWLAISGEAMLFEYEPTPVVPGGGGSGSFVVTTPNTATPVNALTTGANSTGTPTSGFGASNPVTLSTATMKDVPASSIVTTWTNAGDTTYTGSLTLNVYSAVSPTTPLPGLVITAATAGGVTTTTTTVPGNFAVTNTATTTTNTAVTITTNTSTITNQAITVQLVNVVGIGTTTNFGVTYQTSINNNPAFTYTVAQQPGNTFSVTYNLYTSGTPTIAFSFTLTGGVPTLTVPGATVVNPPPGVIGVTVQPTGGSPTTNLIQILTAAGGVAFAVTKNYYSLIGTEGTPPDADVPTCGAALGVDCTVGAPGLIVKVKDSVGTPVTLSLNSGTLADPTTETHGGTGQTTYAKGDLLYASAANTLSKLVIGALNYVLTVNSSGVPVWSPPMAVGVAVSGVVDASRGNVVTTDVTTGNLNTVKLSAGQFLVGSATNPAAVSMSGDATMSSTGAVTLATVALAKGGSGSDLSATGPGLVVQPTAGAALTTKGRVVAVTASQVDKTADTALAVVSNLKATLVAGHTYRFEAVLFINADATGGSQFTLDNGGGTLTATSIVYSIVLTDDSTSANTITSRQTALGGSAGQAGTTAGTCKITGSIVVNAGGALQVQFAQNVANGTSSVLAGSYFKVDEIA